MVSQNTKDMGLPSIFRHCASTAVRVFTAARSTLKALIPRRTEEQKKGRMGEDLTARELEKRGFRIIARNYRFSRNEIDLVASKGKTLLFVEVKTRRSGSFFPLRALGFPQQKRIRLASRAFLREKGLRDCKTGYVFSLVIIDEKQRAVVHLRRFRTFKGDFRRRF